MTIFCCAIVMDSEHTESEPPNEPEQSEEIPQPVKEKKPRSEAQMAVLEKARQKAYEMRAKKAGATKIKKQSEQIDVKLTEAEKDKEILKLKELALEKNLDVEIVKPKPKPKRVSKPKAAPTEEKTPEPVSEQPKKTFTQDARGNLIFHD